MKEKKALKFSNIFNDGCEEFSFVHVEESGSDKIAYALKSPNGESHTQIYELAVEDGFLSGDEEPVGGGIFNATNGEFVRGSIHYGKSEDYIIDAINRKLPSIIDC